MNHDLNHEGTKAQREEISVELNERSRQVVDAIFQVHKAQLLTYMKLTGNRLGLWVNFNVPMIKQGIHRIAL